jgi:hypothetical protein
VATCTNHPADDAAQPCTRCERPFCDRCLAELLGQRLCVECKAGYLSELVGPDESGGERAAYAVPPERRVRHPYALLALVIPVIGYVTFVCSPVTGAVGLWLGARALRDINASGHYSGRTLALAGMVVSGGVLVTWVVAVAATLLFRIMG